MSPVLTTALAPAKHTLEYWREAVGQALVPTTVVPQGDAAFAGRIVCGHVGGLRTASVEGVAQRMRRTAAHIACSPEPLVALCLQVAGRTVLTQDSREATAHTDDLFVYDTSRPYLLDHPERFRTHVIHIPRRMMAVNDADLGRAFGSAFSTRQGCAAALRPMLVNAVASAHEFSPAVAHGLANSVIDLLTALVTEQAAEPGPRSDAPRSHLAQRARAYINQNLGDPALSPDSVARAQHISVRYLHRLFQDEGITVSRLIQRRRLEESAYELARLRRTAPTVSAIAERWGFANPTHFSRAFREAYGLSPREWRTVRLDAGREHAQGRSGT
ncbi:helix-turn-helix domain-containing protein [Streptomyces sp. NPDC005426]|uniref:AraC-like ligand-binding domain-containing protein n=1 Tax=unclassified Streptomyces TaxID=2593676 RepID=UPI00339ED89F